MWVDEVVLFNTFHDPGGARRVFWERKYTHAVLPAPGGAHPSSSDPLDGFDVQHFKRYGELLAEGGIAHGRTLFWVTVRCPIKVLWAV